MGCIELVDIVSTILQCGVLAYIMVKTTRMMPGTKQCIFPFFVVLAMASCLLSNLSRR